MFRAESGTSSEASNSSNEIGTNSVLSSHDSAVIAASQMKPRGLGGSGNRPEILAMTNNVNSLEQAQAEWKMVENIQTGRLKVLKRVKNFTLQRKAISYLLLMLSLWLKRLNEQLKDRQKIEKLYLPMLAKPVNIS